MSLHIEDKAPEYARNYAGWHKKYKPVRNPEIPDHHAIDGNWKLFMFEPGDEILEAADPACIWTFTEGEEVAVLGPGMYDSNDGKFFVTSVPVQPEDADFDFVVYDFDDQAYVDAGLLEERVTRNKRMSSLLTRRENMPKTEPKIEVCAVDGTLNGLLKAFEELKSTIGDRNPFLTVNGVMVESLAFVEDARAPELIIGGEEHMETA